MPVQPAHLQGASLLDQAGSLEVREAADWRSVRARMREEQKAIALKTLVALSEFLDSSACSLVDSSSDSLLHSQSPDIVNDAPTSVILSDIRSLFTLISKETTALSLAFAPPKESWDAVDAVGKKIHDLAGKALFAVSLLRSRHDSSSATSLLTAEWCKGCAQVMDALNELSKAAHKIYPVTIKAAVKITPEQRKLLLVHTKMVWKAVEKTESLPVNERAAFEKAWKSMSEILQDALEEMDGLVKREGKADVNQGKEDEEDCDDFDDFEDDDDDEGEPLPPAELEVAQAAYQLMKMAKALFARLTHASFTSVLDENAQAFVGLQKQGDHILAQQDELAAALYPPQRKSDIANHGRTYHNAIKQLLFLASGSLSTNNVIDAVSHLSLANGDKSASSTMPDNNDRSAKLAAWFDACATQVEKAARTLGEKCEAVNR